MAIEAEIQGLDPGELDKMLGRVDVMLRNEAMEKSLRAASKPVIKEYRKRITPPGYKGDKPGKRPLKSAAGYKQKRYKDGLVVVGVVGARVSQPWSAYHAHLYEDGHRMVVSRGPRAGEEVGVVQGRRALTPAVETTEAEQRKAMSDVLSKYADRASK